MRWLIDCEVTAAPSPDHWDLDQRNRKEVPEPLSDDALAKVAGPFQSLRVYRLLGLSLAPPECLLRTNVIDRLMLVSQLLPEEFGLVILDGWRPPEFQAELMRYYENLTGGPVTGFVADPDDATPPPHTTGGAVDLTLSWRGAPLGLGTDFDDFTPRAAPKALEEDGAPSRARSLRRLLALAMREAGFVVNPLEWWHWSIGDDQWASQTGSKPVYRRITAS